MTTGKPKRVELEGKRAIWLEPLPAYIVNRGDGYFTMLWRGDECGGYSAKSDDPAFLDVVEMRLRENGHSMIYPSFDDHGWLGPRWEEAPADWQRFLDMSSGATIQRNRYYGFCDCGGLAGSFGGYDTRETAVAEIAKEYDAVIGTKPEHLSEYGVTALSGEEYVDRLKVLVPDGPSTYGEFVG